jgi:26S proteasome regulatory subunit N2
VYGAEKHLKTVVCK